MKTTENISLGGLAFTIESDAYTELNRYIEEIKECFRNELGAERISGHQNCFSKVSRRCFYVRCMLISHSVPP